MSSIFFIFLSFPLSFSFFLHSCLLSCLLSTTPPSIMSADTNHKHASPIVCVCSAQAVLLGISGATRDTTWLYLLDKEDKTIRGETISTTARHSLCYLLYVLVSLLSALIFMCPGLFVVLTSNTTIRLLHNICVLCCEYTYRRVQGS